MLGSHSLVKWCLQISLSKSLILQLGRDCVKVAEHMLYNLSSMLFVRIWDIGSTQI